MTARQQPMIALVATAQQQLSQLESVSKGLIDELALSGGQATPRLRDMLARGAGLVAAVQKAADQLRATLPDGPTLPIGPQRGIVDAVWDRHQEQAQEQKLDPLLLPTPVSQPAASLKDLVASMQHIPLCTVQLVAGMEPSAQADTATALMLRCGRTFAAVVQLQAAGGMIPLRVGVLSAQEGAAALSGSGSSSLWAPSQHAVFQQLSVLAAAAMQSYITQQALQQGQQQEPSALELLLLWLATHSDMFSRHSPASGSLLPLDPGASHGLLPPLLRPVLLDWHELWQAALNPQLRQADHLMGA